MTPIEALRALSLRGGAVYVASDGGLEVEGPDAVIEEFLPFVRENKPKLLALLENPRRAACGVWEATLEDVAGRWEVHAKEAHSRGQEPAWLRDDEADMGEVREAIVATTDAQTLTEALEAVGAWKAAWLGLLGAQVEPLEPSRGHRTKASPPPRPAPPCRLSRLQSPTPAPARASCSRKPRGWAVRPRESTGRA